MDMNAYIQNVANPLILVQEPHVDGKGVISKGSACLEVSAIKEPKLPVRACIFYHKSTNKKIWPKETLTTEDCTVVQTKVNGVETLVTSCYMDRNDSLCPPQALRNVVDYAKKHSLALVVGTDSNAHNTAWKSRINDKVGKERGDRLLEYILANNLMIENQGDTPTFDNGRWTNSIDLTITNRTGHNLVDRWKVDAVDRSEKSSDHNYIVFKSKGETELLNPSFRDISKTDWDVYETELETRIAENSAAFKNVDSVDKLDVAAEKLQSSIMEAYNSATEITYISAKVKPPPWDTPEVKNARREMRTKLRLAQGKKKNRPTSACLEASKRASRKEYEKLRDRVWSTKYKEFCEKLEAKSDSKRISSLIKDNKGIKLGAMRKEDGTLTETPSETLDLMTDVHFGNHDEAAPNPTTEQTSTEEKVDPKWSHDHIFSENRVRRALMEFDPLSAAGPDGIRPIMLQKGWASLKDAFISVAKASYLLGHTPASWRNSTGIFLPKPGKDDYSKPKSFRTITLSSVFLKWMERVILWHMEVDLKIHNKLSKKQYGFKRGSSTTAAIHKLVRKLEMAILNKGMALGTFLDIEGAFDNVSFGAINRALKKNCNSTKVNQWIMSMIHGRKTKVELQGSTKVISIVRGCPQGGILSPFLWNLVINELLEYTRDRIPSDLQGFADDMVLVSMVLSPPKPSASNCGGYDAETLREVTQKSLNSIGRWCKESGLSLSHMKSHCVMFTNRRSWTVSKPLEVDGEVIELRNSTKFLGITLDSKLSWNEHIENVCKKAKNVLMQCRKAVGPTWGFKPSTMRWIYDIMVKPILSYGATIWINGIQKKRNQELIKGVQRLANVLITGAMPSTPSSALDVITGIPPLTLWLQEAAAKEALRLKNLGHWECTPPGKTSIRLTSHITTNEKFMRVIPKHITSQEQDSTTSSISIDQCFSVDIPARGEFTEPVENEYDVCCYTDGSKIEEETGAGIVIRETHAQGNLNYCEAYHLSKENSVFQAEVLAVEKAASILLNNKIEGKNILINCDSQSAIQSINSTVIRNKTTKSALNALNLLGSTNEVTLRWIPAHCGYEGNELADQTAKRGSRNDSATGVLLPIPRSASYAALRRKTLEFWENAYKLDPPRTFNMYWKERFEKELPKMNRRDMRVATQLLTGHAALNNHLHKVNPTVPTTCPLCQVDDETVSHFLGQCPALSRIRVEYFDTYYCSATDIFDRFSLRRIISYAHRTKRLEPQEKLTKEQD